MAVRTAHSSALVATPAFAGCEHLGGGTPGAEAAAEDPGIVSEPFPATPLDDEAFEGPLEDIE